MADIKSVSDWRASSDQFFQDLVKAIALTAGVLNPMTQRDDLIVGGTAGAATRFPKGSDGQVLTVDPATHHLIWATPVNAPVTSVAGKTGAVTLVESDIANLVADLAAKAADAAVVHNTGGETVAGIKTFSSAPVVPANSFPESAVTNLVSDLASKATNPMTTQDDVIVGGAAGAPTRLAKGADGQVLTVDPATHHLLWATPAAGFADPTTTKGDLIAHGSTTTRLPVGTDTQVLTADSTQTLGVKWANASSGALDNESVASVLVNVGGASDHFLGTVLGGSWVLATGTTPDVVNSVVNLDGTTVPCVIAKPYTNAGAIRIEVRGNGSINAASGSQIGYGIGLTDYVGAGDPFNNGNGILLWFNGYAANQVTLYKTTAGVVTSVSTASGFNDWAYLRLDRSAGNVFDPWFSLDRAFFYKYTGTTFAFTVARLYLRANGGPVSFDFVDVLL